MKKTRACTLAAHLNKRFDIVINTPPYCREKLLNRLQIVIQGCMPKSLIPTISSADMVDNVNVFDLHLQLLFTISLSISLFISNTASAFNNFHSQMMEKLIRKFLNGSLLETIVKYRPPISANSDCRFSWTRQVILNRRT